jgi:hypothetical protein
MRVASRVATAVEETSGGEAGCEEGEGSSSWKEGIVGGSEVSTSAMVEEEGGDVFVGWRSVS